MALVTAAPRPTQTDGMRRTVRRVWIGVAGGATIVAGIVLIPLPGPGSLVIIGGLTILGREYPRAARAAGRSREAIGNAVTRVKNAAQRQTDRGEDRPDR